MAHRKKKGWFNRNVLAFGFASLFSDMSHEMATAILPIFLSIELHSAAAILGIIEGISDFSSSFFKTFAGWYSDKVGKRKPFILLGYLMTGLFIPLMGFATHWIHVLIAKTLGWLGMGMRSPARDALLSDSVDRETRSKSFGFERMMDTFGAILGPALAFLLLPILGVRNIFFLALIPGILAVVSVLMVREKYKKKTNSIEFWGTIKNMPSNFKRFLLATAVFGIANFANTFLILRVMEALRPSMGVLAAGSIAAGLYALLNVGAAIFAFVFGALGDKMSKRFLVGLGYAIFALYCIGFVALPATIASFVVLFLLAGVETGLIDVMERAYAADLLAKDVRGTGFGLLTTVDGIGDLASSAIAGVLWTAFSYSWSFIYGAILALIAVGILMIQSNNKYKSEQSA
jgi:MFS family permease